MGVETAEDMKIIQKFVDDLIESKKIYKAGNKKGYIEVVRNKEMISLNEFNQRNSKKEFKLIKFVDTEFPVDNDTGLYKF